jgi:hypothetical protein
MPGIIYEGKLLLLFSFEESVVYEAVPPAEDKEGWWKSNN